MSVFFRMQKNTDQKNSKYGHFSRSVYKLLRHFCPKSRGNDKQTNNFLCVRIIHLPKRFLENTEWEIIEKIVSLIRLGSYQQLIFWYLAYQLIPTYYLSAAQKMKFSIGFLQYMWPNPQNCGFGHNYWRNP